MSAKHLRPRPGRKITFRLERETCAELRQVAEARGCSLAAVMQEAWRLARAEIQAMPGPGDAKTGRVLT